MSLPGVKGDAGDDRRPEPYGGSGSGPGEILVITTIEVAPDGETSLLSWKEQEAEILIKCDGFVERLVAQSAHDPHSFINVSRWTDLEALSALQADPAYHQLAARFGVRLFSPEVRDASTPVRGTGGGEAPFHVVQRMRGRLVVAERCTGDALASPGDLMFWYYADAGKNGAADFEIFKRVEARNQLSAPGFFMRYLARIAGEEGGFFYTSVWTDRAAADEFHSAFIATDDYRHYYGRLAPFVTPPTFTDARLRLVVLGEADAGAARSASGPT